MREETTHFDRKSLLTVVGKTADFDELAKDCVAFANAKGGHIHIGIENNKKYPPEGQTIPEDLPGKVVLRISQLTINTQVTAIQCVADNGAEYIDLYIQYNISSIAGTTDGKYYIRIGDQSVPLHPDQLMRLLNDKPSFNWELIATKVLAASCDNDKKLKFLSAIRESPKISNFIKEKTDEEILEYYNLTDNGILTNLGVLWIGTRKDRSSLSHAPVIQFIKYDDRLVVTVSKLITSTEAIRLIKNLSQSYKLSRKERIALGLIAQHQSLTAIEFNRILDLKGQNASRAWLEKLIGNDIIKSKGKTRGTTYSIDPQILKESHFKQAPILRNIEPYRLRELIYEDLTVYPNSSISEINERIGKEISQYKIREQLKALIRDGRVARVGTLKYTRYYIKNGVQ